MYNVMTDFHHSSLLKSFILLFEKRLGGNVYRPIGIEWAEKGFWRVYDHPKTQAQYLHVGGATPDGTPPLNEVEGYYGTGIGGDMQATSATVYLCRDIEGSETNKAITFDGFMSMPIDIVIASIPQHIEPFARLCELHPNKPKLIYQIGNSWDISGGLPMNIMASAKISEVPENINFIEYHQEFDTSIFFPLSKMIDNNGVLTFPGKNIYSFVNVFNGQSHFAGDWQLFEQIERAMPDWNFKSYGGQCRDGSMNGSEELANKMQEARFIWHTKNGGDGYGHVLHNSAAVAKPTIVKKEYYAGKLGEALLIDGETCIAIDGLSQDEIINKILHFSEPNQYAQMCLKVYQNFENVCNFDREFEEIKTFLGQLQ